MNNPLIDVIPASARKYIYAVFALVGLVLGAIPVYYGATEGSTLPGWVNGALAVYAFVAAGIGFTAASNVATPE